MRIMKLMFFLLLIAFPVFSQGPGLPGDDPDTPIDGGVFALMAAGVAYGLKSVRKQKH